MVLNLQGALTRLGCQVTVWNPYPMPENEPHRKHPDIMRKRFEQYLANCDEFDVIDIVPFLWTPLLKRKRAKIVCRTVQPDLHYVHLSNQPLLRIDTQFIRNGLSQLFWSFQRLKYVAWILQGWNGADLVMCLGNWEYEWMRRTFVPWRHKITYYVNALGSEDQAALSQIRQNRRPYDGSRPAKFLWIGRWHEQKGIDLLKKFIAQRMVERPADTFSIAGCGEQAYSDFAPEVLGKQVTIMPSFDRQQLRDLLANHDIGLFTSPVEGWGLSIQEMIESGMPVYATEAGAIQCLAAVLPEMIHSFPPPVDVACNESSSEDGFSRYYDIFNWDNIARRYLRALSSDSRLQSEPIV